MAKVATSDVGRGSTFELGGPDVYTFRELMEKVGTFTGKSKPMQPIPFVAAEIQGWFMEWMMAKPMVTMDQVKLLQSDNVVSDSATTLKDLNIQPQSVDNVVPTYI